MTSQGRLEVEVDRDVCMGSGSCVFEAPGAFALDDDSIAYVVDAAGAPHEKLVAAARKCPTHAITVSGALGTGGLQ